jgi:hypothetical protein
MLERTTDWHLPIFLPSWEGGLFDKVHRVRVYGDGAFDFSGSPSVHVTVKGFEPTFKFERTFGGCRGPLYAGLVVQQAGPTVS